MQPRRLDQTPLPPTLVTGASSGIGRELALQLAGAGTPVIALGRRLDELRALAAHHPNITPLPADLADIDGLPALAARLVAEHPGLGCLINNAGVQFNRRLDDAASDARTLRHEVDVNLVAPMLLAQALLPQLRAQRLAWIVNVTSGLAFAPKRTAAVYSASKAGLHLFTQGLRLQLQGSGVRVVEAVMPLVDTPMTAGRGRAKLPAAQAAAQLISGIRRGRDDIFIGQARWLPALQRWAPGVLAHILQRD